MNVTIFRKNIKLVPVREKSGNFGKPFLCSPCKSTLVCIHLLMGSGPDDYLASPVVVLNRRKWAQWLMTSNQEGRNG